MGDLQSHIDEGSCPTPEECQPSGRKGYCIGICGAKGDTAEKIEQDAAQCDRLLKGTQHPSVRTLVCRTRLAASPLPSSDKPSDAELVRPMDKLREEPPSAPSSLHDGLSETHMALSEAFGATSPDDLRAKIDALLAPAALVRVPKEVPAALEAAGHLYGFSPDRDQNLLPWEGGTPQAYKDFWRAGHAALVAYRAGQHQAVAAPLGKCANCRESPEAVDRYIEALREIAKGKGEFSRDPLKHAQNTIENMKSLAVEALCPVHHDWENVAAGQVQCAHCGTWRERE